MILTVDGVLVAVVLVGLISSLLAASGLLYLAGYELGRPPAKTPVRARPDDSEAA
jgi:hypothetical protein